MSTLDSQFIAQMEDHLTLFESPQDDCFSLMCVDELPCQLHDDVVIPLPTQPGSVKKEDYKNVGNGTSWSFIAVEPLQRERTINIRKHRTKEDYVFFMDHVACQYPKAEKIIIVQDHLNTHKSGSFYETIPADEARYLAKRFEFHYTPKKVSWLKMAEIEISVLSKRSFDRRIGSIDAMKTEAAAYEQRRNSEHATITRRFTTKHARTKMVKHYERIRQKAN